MIKNYILINKFSVCDHYLRSVLNHQPGEGLSGLLIVIRRAQEEAGEQLRPLHRSPPIKSGDHQCTGPGITHGGRQTCAITPQSVMHVTEITKKKKNLRKICISKEASEQTLCFPPRAGVHPHTQHILLIKSLIKSSSTG